ncbi:MAG: PilZ domain-containing protein [Candidatus Omnitrophica bacterium]|nr:PilZ domain-containing protein [Candidatus Omnitrophota bacterium]
MNYDDKRKFMRYRLHNPVRYELKDPGQFGGSLSCDIGEGGMKMFFNDFIPLNSELFMQVFLSPKKIVECKGRVVWIRKVAHSERFEAGLEFSVLDSVIDFRKHMNEFVETSP